MKTRSHVEQFALVVSLLMERERTIHELAEACRANYETVLRYVRVLRFRGAVHRCGWVTINRHPMPVYGWQPQPFRFADAQRPAKVLNYGRARPASRTAEIAA